MDRLTLELLKEEAKIFAKKESRHKEGSLYGVTDGKAVGTYLEHKFQEVLQEKFRYSRGSSAKGIDFPELGIDIKVTSIKQPQSSCPFKSAREKIYGLGYSLLIFVYDKRDDTRTRKATLNIKHVIFVDSKRTGDYQATKGIIRILGNSGNTDDLTAFMRDLFLPVDDIQSLKLAEEILQHRPEIGYLTISNALQWRLQYARVIEQAGLVEGVQRVI